MQRSVILCVVVCVGLLGTQFTRNWNAHHDAVVPQSLGTIPADSRPQQNRNAEANPETTTDPGTSGSAILPAQGAAVQGQSLQNLGSLGGGGGSLGGTAATGGALGGKAGSFNGGSFTGGFCGSLGAVGGTAGMQELIKLVEITQTPDTNKKLP